MASVVIAWLGVLAVVIAWPGVLAVVVNDSGARWDLDWNALRERRIAHQAGDAGNARDRGNRRGDQQFLHGFFLPLDRVADSETRTTARYAIGHWS